MTLSIDILVESGLDPTVINGGIINSLKSTAQLGKGEWSVIESDESDGSFLNLPITYSIVTNIDKEHLDYYGSFKRLKTPGINSSNRGFLGLSSFSTGAFLALGWREPGRVLRISLLIPLCSI